MAVQPSDFYEQAKEKIKQLWHELLSGSPEKAMAGVASMAEDILVVGSGQDEFYEERSAFCEDIASFLSGTYRFEISEEHYAVRGITPDVCCVYGWIRYHDRSAAMREYGLKLEHRFTVICRNEAAGVQICSIHYSRPCPDQGQDSFYPTTLSAVADEALRQTQVLERKLELDSLTGLYNRVYTEVHIATAMRQESGVLYILDLDDFKMTNDTLGHLAGDQTIQEFAQLLRRILGVSAILGRIGGDEFAAWIPEIDRDTAELLFARVADGCQDLSMREDIPICCSAGLADSTPGSEDFTALYQHADRALYLAKANGKGRAAWADMARGKCGK